MLYQELQPIDTFRIKLAHPFSDYDRQLLTLFYQPLTGPEAMSLYMSLWADAEGGRKTEFNHYYLMNLLTMPLQKVFESRITLEAIGLLRTYTKTAEGDRCFIYELLPPADAKTFFADPLLSTFLFSKIGEGAYRNLRDRFAEDISVDGTYADVSRTFLDVFQPVRDTRPDDADDVQAVKGKNKAQPLPFTYDFDFELMRAGLSEQMVPASSVNAVSKELIGKLAFLYSLTPLDMQKIIMMALDENMKLPEDRIRKATTDFYKMNISQSVPDFGKVFTRQQADEPPAETPKSREDKLLYYLENTPPREMLKDISGEEPFSVDVQLSERLVTVHGLSVGVVNVLLQYIILRNDGKITNSFAERIASHWSRKKVTTAKKAMELSRTEHDQYMKWLNEGGSRQSGGRKPVREEKVPEWFYKKEEEQQPASAPDPEMDEKRKQLLEKLQAMKSGVK